MDLNPAFIANIKDLYQEAGNAWLEALPQTLSQLCKKHHCRFIKAIPNLTYHFVGLVEISPSNEIAVLKMAPTNDNIMREAKWLCTFEEVVPKVYWHDEEYHAYLMERLVPGESLKFIAQHDDDKSTKIICQVIAKLHAKQHHIQNFKHIYDLAPALSALDGKIEKGLLSKAQALFFDLCADNSNDTVLHGDLHHDNILSNGRAFKVIDPHGYAGDPAFECGPMIYNPGGEYFPNQNALSQVIDRRLQIMCETLPFDPHRIKAWAFCMTMLSSAWTVQDHGNIPEFELSVAKILDTMNP